jgi:hypothetical protein
MRALVNLGACLTRAWAPAAPCADNVVFGYNLQYQRASLKVQTKQNVADRDLLLSADWSQEVRAPARLRASGRRVRARLGSPVASRRAQRQLRPAARAARAIAGPAPVLVSRCASSAPTRSQPDALGGLSSATA